jgi:hypothetical protein
VLDLMARRLACVPADLECVNVAHLNGLAH